MEMYLSSHFTQGGYFWVLAPRVEERVISHLINLYVKFTCKYKLQMWV